MAKINPLFVLLGLGVVGLAVASRDDGTVADTPADLPDFFAVRPQIFEGLCGQLRVELDSGTPFSSVTPQGLAMAYLAKAYPALDWSSPNPVVAQFRQGTVGAAAEALSSPDACAQFFPPSTAGEQAAAVLAGLTSPEPVPQSFYQVRPADTPSNVIRRALEEAGVPMTQENFIAYAQCIAAGPQWNFRLYSRPEAGTYEPPNPLLGFYMTRHQAGGQVRNIELAFQADNADAAAAVAEGKSPTPNLAFPSAPPSDMKTRGLLWLPPIFGAPGGDLVCSTGSWADGTTTLDPPPEILGLLDQPQGGVFVPSGPTSASLDI